MSFFNNVRRHVADVSLLCLRCPAARPTLLTFDVKTLQDAIVTLDNN